MTDMFAALEDINSKPAPFQFYTAADLWTDEYTSERMLAFHLNADIDVSSRRAGFIDQSVAWMASRFGVGPGKHIADMGCGPGLYSSRLAQLGARVTGVDFSKRSIDHARGMAADLGLAIEYVNQDYLDFETEEPFDLILMIMCDFCALSPSQRSALLRKFGSLLSPDGSILLDVYSLHAFGEREEAATYAADLLDGFWSAGKYYGFLNTFKYHDEKVVLDKYTIIEAGRTRTVYNWLQCFSPGSLRSELDKAGFTRQELYADVAGTPFDETAAEFAVAAKREC